MVYPKKAPNPNKDLISFQIVDIHVTDEELLGLSTRSYQEGDESTVYSLKTVTSDQAYKNFSHFTNRINKAKAQEEQQRQDDTAEWKRKRESGEGSSNKYSNKKQAFDTYTAGTDDVTVPCSSYDRQQQNDKSGSGGGFSFCDPAADDSSGGLINRQCRAIITGVTEDGVNVSAIVPFSPDAYVQVPDDWREYQLEGFRKWLKRKFKLGEDEFTTEYVLKRQYYGWVPEMKNGKVVGTKQFRYIHIRLPLIKYVRKLKWVFQYGIWINGTKHMDLKAWETDVDPITKFCDRTGVVPHGWCSLVKGGWYYPETWYTHSTLEFTLRDIDTVFALSEKTTLAPVNVSSCDGEMYCHAHALPPDQGGYSFPDKNHPDDQTMIWSTSFARVGTKDLTRVIYCLKETDCSDPNTSKTKASALRLQKDTVDEESHESLLAAASASNSVTGPQELQKPQGPLEPGEEDEEKMTPAQMAAALIQADDTMYAGWTVKTHIEWFETTVELMNASRDLLILHSGSKMHTGYNIFGFDFDYTDSQMLLNVQTAEHHRFFYQSLLIGMFTPLRKSEFESSAAGVVETKEIDMVGMTVFDMFEYMKRNFKLKSYKLDRVGQEFLKIRKIEMDYIEMFKKFESGPDGRRENAEYCGRDSDMGLLLAFKLNVPMCTMTNCRVYVTNSNEVIKGGQQVRVLNQYIVQNHANGVVMNFDYSMNVQDGYEGATVFDAKRGYYNTPIVVLDFASLYPSVMRFFLFCPSTLVMEDRYKNLPGVVYHISKTDLGDFWYVQSINEVAIFCVTSDLLDKLLATRAAKKVLKKIALKEGREFDADIAEMEQLAVKGSTNSVYGFHGVKKGKCPCTPVAASTTCEGRALISCVLKDLLDKRPGTVIIYGDTDSVFILYAGMDESDESLKLAFQYGAEDAKHCSRNYKGIVNLEQDKVMQPFLCDKKKRYMGIVRKEDGTSEFVAKGVEMVRRDRAPFVTEAQKLVSRALLYQRNPKLALEMVQTYLKNLREGKIPMDQFVISQSLKRESDYAKPESQGTVVVNRKIAKRKGAGAAYKVGDRVETIVIHERDPKKQRVVDKIEDPAYAKEHKLTPDYLHYLGGFKTAMCALMEPFYDDPEQIYKETEALLYNKSRGLQTLDSMFTTPVVFSASFNSNIKRNQNHLSAEEIEANKLNLKITGNSDTITSSNKINTDALVQQVLSSGMTFKNLVKIEDKKKVVQKRKKDSNKATAAANKKPKCSNLASMLF